VLGALLAGAVALWLLVGRRGDEERARGPEAPQVAAPPMAPAPRPTPAPPPAPPPVAAAPEEKAPESPPPSHPITPERVRIQKENSLIQEANDAMDLEDAPRLRAAVAAYRAEGFEDVDKLADGYEIVANCIEHPGEASRAAAQAFWDRERASILRRHVHRHCLESR
jgi:hypothetical protein